MESCSCQEERTVFKWTSSSLCHIFQCQGKYTLWKLFLYSFATLGRFVSHTIFSASVSWACSVQFSCSVVSDFATPWTTACQDSLSITNSRSSLKLLSIESVMQSSHLLSSPSPPAFNLSQHQALCKGEFFTSGGQSIGVSASALVLPMNIQDSFPLGWTGCMSLKSKRLSKVFCNTTVQRHQFFGVQLLL